MERTNKDQRLKVLLLFMHNENVWMLVVTQDKPLEPLKSSQPPNTFLKDFDTILSQLQLINTQIHKNQKS